MPYQRPGPGVYVRNTSGGNLTHNRPVKVGNFVGVSVKQKATAWSDALSASSLIADNEDFFLITKGIVQVPFVAGFAKGDAVYITSGNVLTETGSGNTPFGRVVEIPGERGTPSGKVRIDLDQKDSVPVV